MQDEQPKKTGPGSGVRYLEVDATRAGQRLDNFLIGQLKGVPKSHVYRLLRKGEVRVNKGRAKPDYRVQAGDSVRLPPIRQRAAAPKPGGEGFEWLRDRVLHEDEDLLVLNKPAGLPVHGGSGVPIGLIEALRALYPEFPMLELVHRLDRDTSGCLLFAKSRSALLALHAGLREGRIEKRYTALVRGRWRGGTRHISAALARDQVRDGERLVGVSEDGREAESRFTPKGFYGPATLMEILLLTGRTHQARVHAQHTGHPIAGDDKYGERDFNREVRRLGLKRLFLHAARLRFDHPSRGTTLDLEAPLPADLTQFLDRIRDAPPL
jgi:23S rRNA pseudouridine955/2504/2580 synthase